MVTDFLRISTLFALVYFAQIATDRPVAGHWLRSAAKTLATLGLVGAAIFAGAYTMITLGLALGAAGDFFLSRRGQAMFLAGMAAFTAGHLAYVAAFWSRAGALGLANSTNGQWAALTTLALVITSLGLWLSSRAGTLRFPVLGYAAVIGLMAGSALVLPNNMGLEVIQLGVTLFLLSDALLALRLFVARPSARKPLDLVVWPAYLLGQALILFGSLDYWEFPIGDAFPSSP